MKQAPLSSISVADAAGRIALFAREGRLVQGEWAVERGGRQLACLLGSIDGRINSVGKCPSQLMPCWAAGLLVRLFDGLPEEKVPELGEKFAGAFAGTSAFGDKEWSAVLRGFLQACIRLALDEAPEGYKMFRDKRDACTKVVMHIH